jgi:two-component system LytT family sensor kinase
LFFAIAGHILIKHLARFIISKATPLREFFIIVSRDGLIVFGLWMIILYWISILPVPSEIRFAWVTVIPTGILLHGLAFRFFLPPSLRWKYPLVSYFFKVGLFCLVDAFAISIVIMIMTDNEDFAFTMGAFSGIVNLVFTAPALLLIYRWQMKGDAQIFALQGELNRSAANLDLLRSQINPHFLFNALNTIYGLAIQEKAERTSASVEKLGDMMRFMLLENMQERISLKRELEYLDNYISLQKLRTDANPGLNIHVEIPQEVDPIVRIAPMLLVPFVENAFKHGISMREQSYIKISLELKNSTLYFDVSNSIRQKVENDPEKDSNGIGLENVRQRLKHMYAGKHELLVRPTSHDFFVHLRMELD